jgi:hypothetical protein
MSDISTANILKLVEDFLSKLGYNETVDTLEVHV